MRRSEDHRRRADTCEHLSVVAGARGEATTRVPRCLDRPLHDRHHASIELDGLEPSETPAGDDDPFGRRDGVDEGIDLAFGSKEERLVGVANVERERRRFGNDVDQVRVEIDTADGAHLVPSEPFGEFAEKDGDPSGDDGRIMTEIHRSRSRVIALAVDANFLPRDPLNTRDRTESESFPLEDGTLFDVQFDERMRSRSRTGSWPRVLDPSKLVSVGGTIDRDRVECFFDAHPADVDERTEHVGLETGAFLVAERRDGQGAARPNVSSHEGLDDFESSQDTKVSVVAAAGANCVDVRAGHDRRSAAHLPRSRDIADDVDRYLEPEVAHPRDDQVSSGSVVVGQRQSAASATIDGADTSQLGQTAEEATTIDPRRRPHPSTHATSLHFVKWILRGSTCHSRRVSGSEWMMVGVAVLVAATAQYTAGFGFALLGVPLMALAIDTHDAVVIAVWLGLVTSTVQTVEGWSVVDRPVATRLIGGSLIGIPIGSTIFVLVPERTLTVVLGVSVLVATVVLSRGLELSNVRRGPEWTAGIVSGALASSLSTNGPPLVAVLQARRYPMNVFRATINTVFAFANVVTLIAFVITDELRAEQIGWSFGLLPLVGIGLVFGGRLRRHIDEPRARRLVLTLLGIAGVSAISSAVLG